MLNLNAPQDARRPTPPSRDDGFTLIELTVAMFIILIVITSLLGFFISSLSSVAQAKQRQTATALATQMLERMRALPYDVVKAGVKSGTTAFTNDPNIVDKTTTPRLRPGVGGIDEVLLSTSAQVTPPLDNHRTVSTVDGIAYTVGVYVTQAATPQPAYNLTALVSYSTAASKGPKTVVQRSTSYSPTGCLSTATHPYSGPCQASFSMLAGVTAGGFSVTHPSDATADIEGFGDGKSLELDLATTSASSTIEQTTTLRSLARTSSASANDGGTVTSTGGRNAVAAADSDPSSAGTSTSSSASTPAQTSSAQQLSGGAGVLVARPSTADSGTSDSQVAAGAAGCMSAAGSAISSGQPCSSSSVGSQGTTASLTLDLDAVADASAGRALPTFTLASIAPDAAPSRAMAGRFTSTNSAACTGTPNCAHAEVRRSLGDILVGSLPARTGSDVGPGGFTEAFRVTGLVEQARAESGTGSRSPVMTRSAGTLHYWDGTTNQSLNLATVASDLTIDPPPVTARYVGVGFVDITQDTVIFVSGPKTTSTTPANCKPVVCRASGTSAPTVRAQTLYSVHVDGVRRAHFLLTTDLGALVAQSSYGAAPDA